MSRITEAFWRLSHPDKYEAARPLRDRMWIEVSKLLPDRYDEPWRCKAAMVLIGAMLEGPDVNRLVRLTGYQHDFVAQVAVRMRAAGLWIGDNIDCGPWGKNEPDGHIYFTRDLCVADGKLFRNPKDGCYIEKIRYQAPGPKKIADPGTRRLVLHKLQAALLLQTELWDVTSSVAEILEWSVDDLTNWITTNSTDEASKLTEADVDYHFGRSSGDPSAIDVTIPAPPNEHSSKLAAGTIKNRKNVTARRNLTPRRSSS